MANVVRKGNDFTAEVIPVEQYRLDGDCVKTKLTPAEIKDCTYDSSYVMTKTTRIDSSKKPEFKIPNLANMTMAGAIDLLGAVREQEKECKKLEGIYKDFIDALLREEAAKAAKDSK